MWLGRGFIKVGVVNEKFIFETPSIKFYIRHWRGICQGSVLSPTLFNIIMDPLLKSLESSVLGLCVNGLYGGVYTFTQMMLEPCLPQCPLSRPRSILYSALPGRTFCSSIRANARLYLSVRTTTSNTLLAKLRGKSSRQVESPSALATNGTMTSLLSHQWNIMSQRQGNPSLHMAV